MPRHSKLSSDDLIQMKELYSQGMSRRALALMFGLNATTIYYHLGLKKPRKAGPKRYLDYVRDDCKRRGVPYVNPRSRDNRLWS